MFMDKKGGVTKFSAEIFCLTVPKTYVVEPFSVSLVSDNEKFCSSVGYVTVFRRKTFVLTVPKLSVEEPFYAVFQKISGSEKVSGEEGGVSRFSFENFLSHSIEKIVGQPFRVSLISGLETFYASEVYVTIFRRTFSLAKPENFAEEPFCAVFQKFSSSEKVYG